MPVAQDHADAYSSNGQAPPDAPEREFARHLATLDDEGLRASIKRARFLATQDMPDEALDGPEALDIDAEDAPPDYLVAGLIERGTVVVLSGDTGAAKSIVASSLIPAALRGDPWLSHATSIERVLMVDEENPRRLARARLRALGIPAGSRDRLRYFSRAGVAIGDGGRWDALLRGELGKFKPDLVVIDTLMAACALEDTNSNPEAVRLMKHLRGLAEAFECAILLLHHERKQSKDNPRSSGQAMMGARQWAGQADSHMTLTVESDFSETETDEGTFETRRTFKWRPAEKDRDGQLNRPRRVAVTSERGADRRLRWMVAEDEGPVDGESMREQAETKILEALRDAEGDLTRPELAAICGEEEPREPSGTFKRVLSGLVDAERVEKPDRLRYRLTDDGVAAAGLGI